jgi:predicted AAA+ superfamily ATPase
MKMTDYQATAIAEGWEPALDEKQIVEAWQHLIDTGLAWRLQGWFGRTASALIEQGVCHEAKNTARWLNA